MHYAVNWAFSMGRTDCRYEPIVDPIPAHIRPEYSAQKNKTIAPIRVPSL